MHGLPSPTSGSSKSASSAVYTILVGALTHHDHPDEQGFSGMDDGDLDYHLSDHMELSDDEHIGICTEILSHVKGKQLIYCNHLYRDSNKYLSKCKNNK